MIEGVSFSIKSCFIELPTLFSMKSLQQVKGYGYLLHGIYDYQEFLQ